MRTPLNLARTILALTALLALVLLPGCRPAQGQDTLLVAGSTTLASYLDPMVAAFQKKHPNASILSEAGGSTAGVIALKRGAIDVAGMARDVDDDEDDLALRDYLIARDGVAVIVHPSNKITNLTVAQLTQIVSGEIRSWKDVGGGDGPLVFIDRKKDSRARKSMIDMLLGGDDALRGAREVGSGKEMDEAVKADPQAIGFVALKHLTKDAKTLSLNGVPVSRATMLSGRYPLTRSFYLAIYRKPTKVTEEFLEFALSAEGQTLLEDDGLIGVH